MSSYTQGDLVELPVTFKDSATGEPIDPTTVAIRVVSPSDVETTYPYPSANITRNAVGDYVAVVDSVAAGLWLYEWVVTGNVQGVEPGDFYVETALPGAAEYRRIRGRLSRMCAAASEPTLDEQQLDEILAEHRVPDSEGRLPTDEGWVPRWNLRAAAATGWEWQAGQASGDFDFGEDGQRFNRSQVIEHCLRMARIYRRGSGSGSGSVTLVTPYSGDA